jgi:tRNA U55 pseudouridine synthase TruB
LVEDVGRKLSTGAYMSALRRTKVGQFSLADSIGIKDLTPEAVSSRKLTL